MPAPVIIHTDGACRGNPGVGGWGALLQFGARESTANRRPVKNRDLWERLDALIGRHDITWHWVKAHAGHAGNERADQLANRAIDEYLA